MKKIKFYAPVYLLAAGLAFASPTITAHAEETEAVATSEASEEEEVLFEQTEEAEKEQGVVFEDITPENEKTDEQKAQEEAERIAAEQAAKEEAEKARQEAERIEAEKAAQEAIIGSTTIDAEDQEYNTGRTEIPDTVLTEAERKGIDKIPDNPNNPDNPENPDNPNTPENPNNPSNPSTPTTDTPEKITIPVIPKTAMDLKSAFIGGIGLGIGAGSIGALWNLRKVTGSRKVFGKKKNTKKGLSR